MATILELLRERDEKAKARAHADAELASVNELIRAEVTAQEVTISGAKERIKVAVNKALASVQGDVDTITNLYATFWLRIESAKNDDGSKTLGYTWPTLTHLPMGAGISRTPRASGGKATTHKFSALDTSKPKIQKPNGLSYEQWLGVDKTSAFKSVATPEQLVEVDGEQATMKAEGATQAAIGSMVDKYRNDVIGQAVAAGKLTPVR